MGDGARWNKDIWSKKDMLNIGYDNEKLNWAWKIDILIRRNWYKREVK